jgi:hypothetical protein
MDDCLRPEELRLSHHCNTGPGMSALGHKRTFAPQQAMCALHPKADMCGATRDVCYGPIADMGALGLPRPNADVS